MIYSIFSNYTPPKWKCGKHFKIVLILSLIIITQFLFNFDYNIKIKITILGNGPETDNCEILLNCTETITFPDSQFYSMRQE